MRYLPALTIALFALPLCAHAQDQGLCTALDNILPGANSGFAGIKAEKTDKDLFAVTQILPYAHECELRYDRHEKTMTYACYFRIDAGRDAKVEMANYATNVAACRPDMVRSGNDEYIEVEGPQGQVHFSFSSTYVHEFNVYIERAD